ncbi:MAG TPA: potassium-transporting ATPase subunit KdpC [Intrasporangiaceae bacterium]|nr:potassium-transporting ATPase subunit KdpC [Intrasporangiaceae bacterium]
MSLLRPTLAATRMLLVLTVLFGIAYPALMTGIGRLVPGRADGSIITVDGTPVGSSLLGQAVEDPALFHGRPSASGASGETSGGTNLGPSSAELAAQVAERESLLRAANPAASGPVPADALTASASGLDPHISPEYATWQLPRIAAATGLSRADLEALIADHTARPALGLIGNRRVNVTELNADLAAALAARADR